MKFSELVVIGELQSLCESFTGVTGAVTAILDLEGNILVATGWQDICTKFHRVQPLTARRCHESDTALAGQLSKGQTYNVYKCKNGLVDVAVPLVVGGVHVANFFTGQFFFSEPDKDYFLRQAEEFGFDKASYLEALNRAPILSEDKVRSLMDFFTRLARLIGEMGLDILERKRIEVHLQQAATVFDSTADAVSITAPDGSILAINRAFTEITGYTEAEVIGLNLRLLQSGRQSPEFYCDMWDSIARNGRWRGELWNKRKSGSVFPVWLTITAVKDSVGNLIQYVGVFSDSSAIKKAQEQLDFQAHHDPLTGLPNRLLLEDRIQGALQRARRDQSSLALLFVDLDRFKTINDTFGHHLGDLVLCEVAQRFCRLTRESDTVARLGGDEFLIVLEGIDDPSDASRIADKILDDLRALPVNIDHEFFIGASIGISLFPQDGDDDTSLIRNADVAMYRAKQRGRNTYEFFTNDLTISSLERFQMETDLHRAIERGELRVYLQPQFSLSSGELTGAEALVRWQHPQHGLVLPGHFISLAEESGLIVQMGQWVQRTACAQWAQWVADGLTPGVLSINVSAIEFRRGDILDSLRSTLAATRLDPELLELEITESAIMSHAENSIQVLHELRAMGLSLAIDDFGTGYSSLAYLKQLPLNKLKVDQSFIRGLPGDAEDIAITRAVIALGHCLHLRIIAECVETEAQYTFLAEAGCDEMQGYLRGRPVPFDDFFRAYLRR